MLKRTSSIHNIISQAYYSAGVVFAVGLAMTLACVTGTSASEVLVVTIASPVSGASYSIMPLISYAARDGTVVVTVDGTAIAKASGDSLGRSACGTHESDCDHGVLAPDQPRVDGQCNGRDKLLRRAFAKSDHGQEHIMRGII